MKPRTSQWLKLTTLCLAALLLVAGCAKRDAQKALDQATQAQEQARNELAPKYARDAYQDANRLMNMAQTQFDAGEYQQAIESAQQAQSRFLAAVNAVPEVRQMVEDKMAEIGQALAEAEQNIQTARDQGYLTSEEINAVASTVEDLRARYEGELQDEVEEQALDGFMQEVQSAIPQTESLATAHLRPEAEQARDNVVALMEEAQELNAPSAAPQVWGQISDLNSQLQSAERDGQWQRIIEISDQMVEPLNTAITTAQRSAAGDIINDTQQMVQNAEGLSVAGVPAYGDMVSQSREALSTGQELLAQENYSGAIAAADEAKLLLEQADQALGDQTDVLIGQAEADLSQAVGLDAETYAPSVVSQVRDAVSRAQELKGEGRFAEAYSAAQRAAEIAADAPEAARRGKAQRALSQVEQPFNLLRSQGGDQYGGDAYETAFETVRELRGMMDSGQYDQVEEQSPAAVEVVEEALDAVARASREFITRAERAISEAEDANAPQWTSMQFANAVNLKSAAQNEYERDRFLASIQKSEDAISTAQTAESRAYQLQAEQNLRRAGDLIAEARRADQDDLSPNAYRNALYSVDEATSRLGSGDYEDAYETSVEALDLSSRALNNLVLSARESVDSLLLAQGVSFAPNESQQAAALLNDAEAAQSASNYDAANQAAMKAIEIASSAERFTWKQRSYSLLQNLEGSEELLEQQLAPQKTPALYRNVLDNLTEARVQRIDGNYAESFARADEARDAIDQIWLAMEADLTRVKMEASQLADWLGENAENESGREMKMRVLDAVAELDRQIKLDNWRSAYTQAKQVEAAAEFAMESVQDMNRVAYRKKLKETFAPFNEQNALTIVPDQAERVEQAMDSLYQPDDMTYAEVVEEYNNAMELADELPDEIMTQAQQRTEEIASILQQAQDAGGREFFPDKFRELNSDLQWLRNAQEGEDYKMIAHRLAHLESNAPKLLQATQLAVEEDAYLANLDDYLVQVNNLMQDFSPITNMIYDQLTMARATEYKLDETALDMYSWLQRDLTAKSLRINAEILLERVKDLEPPETLESLQKKAVKSFALFLRGAEGFETYGESRRFDLEYREEALKRGFEALEKAKDINADLAFAIDSSRKMTKWEKFVRNTQRLEEKFLKSFYSWEIK